MARSRTDLFGGAKPGLNMSAMIDLVSLLLIFFMVASKMITSPQVEDVEIPLASAAEVPRNVKGRVIINVTSKGKVLGANGRVELSSFDIQQMMRRAREVNPKTQLLLRTDQSVNHEVVKEVLQASAKGGVTNVVFSTFQN